ncbi:uncharacterized protein TNCV_3235451 [Trichonephila clavipes]|nr:uncharacterized protein TNCV_3235451 [Trichonephila clavipes]
MDLNSEKSGYSYKSRSSCSGTSNSTTFTSECQTLPNSIKSPEPVLTQNNFDNLEQGVEHSLNTENNAKNNNENETIVPKPKLPSPIMLKIKKNYREQLKIINEKFPEITSKNSGDYIRNFTNDFGEQRNVMHFLEESNEFEFYAIPPKGIKPIKVVIKELPGCTKPSDNQLYLEEIGYTVASCKQLISKVNKNPLPFFLVTLPRNNINLPIFDLTLLGFMQCGEEHLTKDCKIKERQENPFCINCHAACYTKCPKFPHPKKGTPVFHNEAKKNFESKNATEGFSFADALSGTTPQKIINFRALNNENKGRQSQPQIILDKENNASDIQNLIDIFKIISNLVKQFPKLIEILPKLKATDDLKEALLLLESLMDS